MKINANGKTNAIRYVMTILALAVCLCSVGCGNRSDGLDEKASLDTAASSESSAQTDVTTVEKIRYVYQTKYRDLEFLSEEEMQAWREPLVALLSNVKTEVYDACGELIGYTCLYPDRPYVVDGYSVALFDINTDGVPEVLVDGGGGSAGNAFYFVYDLMTGTELGTMDGGFDDAWCIYFNHTTGAYETIGQFGWRNGWMRRSRYVEKAVLTHKSGNVPYLHEVSWITTCYEVDHIEIPMTDKEIEMGYQGAYAEIYPIVEFYVYGNPATLDEYLEAQDHFEENYTRIVETGLRLVRWGDVSKDEDDVVVKAEKMADALLAIGQRFLKPLSQDLM